MSEESLYKGIFHYLWHKNSAKVKLCLFSATAMLLCSKAINVIVPIIFKLFVDNLNGGSLNLAIFMVIAYGVARFSAQFFNECKEAFFIVVEQNSIHKISLDVFKHLHSLSIRFYLSRKMGSTLNMIERGIRSIETILRFSSFNIIPTFFEIMLVSIILLSTYSVYYSIIIAFTLTAYISYTIIVTQWRTQYIKLIKKLDNQSSSKMVDSIVNYETVKHFNNERFEQDNYSKLIDEYKAVSIKGKISLSMLNIGQVLIISLGLVLVCILAARDLLIYNSITLGDVILLNSYLLQLYQPLSNLGFSYREVKLASIDAKSIFKLLAEKPEIQNVENPLTLDRCSGNIEFKNISFHYDNKKEIIKNISFTVEAGQTIAIVGKSGSGKSTMAKLLMRFYDVTKGIISLDEKNISNINIDDLRHSIGIVPQDTVLFHDTIYYNIAYGKPDAATLTKVQKVAKLASIDQFIEKLPLKYDTTVGERGLKLSGGEKQRIAIARVLLKNPQVFIFDEATSSLDTKTEKEIQDSINKASKGHTTIIIAHRLSTIKDAYKILVMDEGQIIESGAHNDLMNNSKGMYYQMWKQQEKNSGSQHA